MLTPSAPDAAAPATCGCDAIGGNMDESQGSGSVATVPKASAVTVPVNTVLSCISAFMIHRLLGLIEPVFHPAKQKGPGKFFPGPNYCSGPDQAGEPKSGPLDAIRARSIDF